MATIRHRLRMRGLLFILMLAIPSVMLIPVAAIAQSGLQFNKSPVKGGAGNLDVKETPTDVRINLEGDVLFDFDKWDIRKQAEASLRKLAEIIKKYPKSEVLIEGHTDGKGSEEYNQRWIFYSLGNFVFDEFSGKANRSAVLRVTLFRNGTLEYSLLPMTIVEGVPLTGD